MSIETLKEQARRHEQKEEWSKALELYRKAIGKLSSEEQPDIGLYNRAGDIQSRIGDLEGAVKNYERAVDLYLEAELPNNAIAICKKVLRNLPARATAYLRMGQIRASQGFLTDARQNFLAYAELMEQAGEMEEAFRALIEFTNLAPHDMDIREGVAAQLATHGSIPEAIEQLNVIYRYRMREGNAEAAERVRDQILSLDPEADMPTDFGADEPEAEVIDDLGFESTSLAFDEAEEEEATGSSDYEFGEIEFGGESASGGAPDEAPEEEDAEGIGGFEIGGAVGSDDESSDDGEDEAGDFEIGDVLLADAEADVEADGDAYDGAGIPDDAKDAAEVDAAVVDAAEVDAVGGADEESDFSIDDGIAAFGAGVNDIELDVVEPHGAAGDADALNADALNADAAADADDGVKADDDGEDFELDLPLMDYAEDEGEDEDEAADLPLIDLGLSGDVAEDGTGEADDSDGLEGWAGGAEPDAPEAEETDPHESARVRGEALIEEGDRTRGLAALTAVHRALAEEGRLDRAMRIAREVIYHDPDTAAHRQTLVEYAHRANDRTLLIPAFVDLAECLARGGETGKANAVYRQVLEVDPGNRRANAAINGGAPASPVPGATPAGQGGGDGFLDLGSMVLDEGGERSTRWTVSAEAPSGDEEADFRRLLSQFKAKVAENVAGDDFRAHYDLGTAYREMGLLDEAIGEFQQALRATGGSLATYEMLGQCFLEGDQPEVAVRTLNKALDIPYEVEDELLGIYYYLARAFEATDDPVRALEFYEKVFTLDINFMDATERLRALRR